MTVVEKEIHMLELEITKLKVESTSPYNDGWMTEHYKKELDKANKVHAKKVAEVKSAPPERTNREDAIGEMNEAALLADGFADALVGYDASASCAVYDYNTCCQILMNRDGMEYDEAHEYMEFNVVSAVVGDFMPIFVTLFENEI